MSERKESKKICGIVMPISSLDGCTEDHWGDVLSILTEAIENAGFDANLVSNADDVGIIQKRIIQNLYDNPVVVCDVSGKNPNVMFELGMRLAFDRPTIIVKDDKTTYSFDTSPIEHLEYPRDLRFGKIVDFKNKLREKIKHTYNLSVNDPSYTTFLKHFGEFKVAKLETKEVSGVEYILEELRGLRNSINLLERGRKKYTPINNSDNFTLDVSNNTQDEIEIALSNILKVKGIQEFRIRENNNKRTLELEADESCEIHEIHEVLGSLISASLPTRKRSTKHSNEH
jgi:hypothetical protein